MKSLSQTLDNLLKGKPKTIKGLFSYLIVPTAVLLVYCSTFTILSTKYLQKGVNSIFTGRLGVLLVIPMVFFLLGFIILLKMNRIVNLDLITPRENLESTDLILLLLPLSPIVQYILNNQDILSTFDSVVILMFFIIFSGIQILIIPWILGHIGSFRVLKIIGLSFSFTITYMAILSKNYSWLNKGSLKIQLLFFFAIFLLTYFLYRPKNKWILYIPILAFFSSNLIMQIPSIFKGNSDTPLNPSDFKLVSAVEGRQPMKEPNVYLLLYDAYVPNETMKAYGIDNSEQEKYLHELGFTFYPRTYTLFADTMRSMGRVLNASMVIEGDLNSSVSGDGKVMHLFKDLGYQTYGIFPYDFMFRGRTPKYDYYIPKFSGPTFRHMLSAILIGEFRFDIGFYDQNHSEFITEKQQFLLDASRKRSFVYMHTNVPSHSQNSGACLPDEIDLYKNRLNSANGEMKLDLETILKNDPDSLIIVAGDHGPFLTKNCGVLSDSYKNSEISRLDIQDRYGTFLAIKWPDEEFTHYDEITILQDIFPAVFAYLHQDSDILKTKIDSVIKLDNVISGVTVNNGIISGGKDDGEPLFLSQ